MIERNKHGYPTIESRSMVAGVSQWVRSRRPGTQLLVVRSIDDGCNLTGLKDLETGELLIVDEETKSEKRV